MAISQSRIRENFREREYRESYAEGFLSSWISQQLATIRRQRKMTQQELAASVGTKQPGVARMERDDYGRWSLPTLQRVAFALGCRLRVSFETFGTLIQEVDTFSLESLQRPSFDDDPVFVEKGSRAPAGPAADMRHRVNSWIAAGAPVEQIGEWLQGNDLPAVGDETLPCQWILEGLDQRDQDAWHLVADRLSRAIVHFRWDVEPPGGRPSTVEQLFGLAEGLRCASILGDALFTALQRHSHSPLTGDAPVPGDALARAIMFNQPDGRFRNLWWGHFLRQRAPQLMPEYVAFGLRGISYIGIAPNVSSLVEGIRNTQAWQLTDTSIIQILQFALGQVWNEFTDDPRLPVNTLTLAERTKDGWNQATLTAWRRSRPDILASEDHRVFPLLQNVVLLTNNTAA
jgi:transcriptional regulator with XRE-family HTH domain